MNFKWRPAAEQVVVEPFRLITASLLSLVLPLSFLLLSRLSSAHCLLTATSASPSSSSYFFSVFLHTNPALLYVVVSSISISALIHGLTSKISSPSNLDRLIISRPRLHISWILLCVLQVSVGLGIEGTIDAGVSELTVEKERGLFSKVIFFLGLHEIMLLWYREIIKPVVDDTLFGDSCREERMLERVALAVSCGTLWWWKLRDEVEALVNVAEAKRELLLLVGGNEVDNNNNFEVVDFVNWWLYYLVVTVGMVRVVKGLLWVGMILLFKRVRRNSNRIISSPGDNDDDDDGIDDKV